VTAANLADATELADCLPVELRAAYLSVAKPPSERNPRTAEEHFFARVLDNQVVARTQALPRAEKNAACKFLVRTLRNDVIHGVFERGTDPVRDLAASLVLLVITTEPTKKYALDTYWDRRELAVEFIASACRQLAQMPLDATPQDTVALSPAQAARRLGVKSPNTVKNWIRRGWFPRATQGPGQHWHIPTDDVERFRDQMAAASRWREDRSLGIPRLGGDTDDF